MEDPKVYELIELMLDEMKESRREYREGFSNLGRSMEDLTKRMDDAVEEQKKTNSTLLRLETLFQNQTKVFTDHLKTIEAPQNTKILELERRLEAVERKVA